MPGSNAPPGPGASSSSSRMVVRWASVVSVVSASVGRGRRGAGVVVVVVVVAAAGTHPQDVSLFQRCLFMAELHESRLPVPQPVGLLTIEILLHVEHHHSSTAPGQVCFVFFSLPCFVVVFFCWLVFFLYFFFLLFFFRCQKSLILFFSQILVFPFYTIYVV